ncbi:MAG: NYN domain-containing protein [Nitrospirae bacterium]|nr:NYN domain-containing protein [Nitrospirota bacterium]
MAHILIDGYNLIGVAHRDLERAREDLVRTIYEYANSRDHRITVVFDGWKSGKREETKTVTGNLTVIYSRLGDKADNVIKKILASSAAKQWIVVSSDREISDFAEKKDFVAFKSAEFESRLYAVPSFKGTNTAGAASDEDVMTSRRSGNPRRLSKKEKKKLLAYKKL